MQSLVVVVQQHLGVDHGREAHGWNVQLTEGGVEKSFIIIIIILKSRLN